MPSKPKISGNLLRLNKKTIVEKMIADSEYKKPQKFWGTPTIVKERTDDEKWEYISGFWDADGGLPRDPKSVTQKCISFSQKSRETLEFIKDFLMTQRIKTTNLTYTGQIWQIRITRKSAIRKFYAHLRSRNREKLKRLKMFIASLS
jgi:intein/homing endonuclease